MTDDPALESALQMIEASLPRWKHSEAVSECYHCNVNYIVKRMRAAQATRLMTTTNDSVARLTEIRDHWATGRYGDKGLRLKAEATVEILDWAQATITALSQPIEISDELHRILEAHGVASRTDGIRLATELVSWAARSCRQTTAKLEAQVTALSQENQKLKEAQ